MDENLHNIDDLFRKAINEHEEMPSRNVWEQIDKNLDKKKVVFISQKYNKLKWVAAALLMFSAGMAMYTLHTKLKNRELLKQNTVRKKEQIEKYEMPKNHYLKNDTDGVSIAKVEKKAITKDIATIIKEKNKIKLSRVDNATARRKVMENDQKIRESKTENPDTKISIKQPTGTFVGSLNINRKKYRQKVEEQLVSIQGKDSLERSNKRLSIKGSKTLPLVKRQKDLFNTTFKLSPESERKEVAAEVEVAKRDLKILSNDFLSQHLLKMQSIGINKITTEKKLIVKAAKNNIKRFKKSLFSATLFFSPDFVSSKVDNDHHRFREEDKNEIKDKEEIKNSYSAGILIDYKAGRNFSVASGINFSSMTTAIAPKTIYARPDRQGNMNYQFNCSSGYTFIPTKTGNSPAEGDSIRALSAKNLLQYIGVPFVVKYKLSKGKFALNPGFGIAINFLTKGKIETAIDGIGGAEKANIDHIEGLSKVYLNGSLSLSANYNLNKNLALNFTPAARFGLNSINKAAPVKTYLNSFGLAAGLLIRL